MARDERLEGLCKNRKNEMVAASYYSVRVRPMMPRRMESMKQKILLDYIEDRQAKRPI